MYLFILCRLYFVHHVEMLRIIMEWFRTIYWTAFLASMQSNGINIFTAFDSGIWIGHAQSMHDKQSHKYMNDHNICIFIGMKRALSEIPLLK